MDYFTIKYLFKLCLIMNKINESNKAQIIKKVFTIFVIFVAFSFLYQYFVYYQLMNGNYSIQKSQTIRTWEGLTYNKDQLFYKKYPQNIELGSWTIYANLIDAQETRKVKLFGLTLAKINTVISYANKNWKIIGVVSARRVLYWFLPFASLLDSDKIFFQSDTQISWFGHIMSSYLVQNDEYRFRSDFNLPQR